MKATIEFDDELYRQLKATAALRGAKVKEPVAEGVRMVLGNTRSSADDRWVKLPLIRSRRPGTLHLTGETIANLEANLDAGRQD